MTIHHGRVTGAMLLALGLLAACSTPPRGRTVADDPAPRSEEAPPESSDRYGLEDEGEVPEAPGDVAFEEDALPPRPEDVGSTTLEATPVTSEDVASEEPEALPDPDGRIEPTVKTPVAPTVSGTVEAGSSVEVRRGFRVQLVAVDDYARANTLAADARQRLGVPVHVVSEPPYYKVRAGDFLDRADAVRLKERATSLGFDGCWVVTDEVELQKSPPGP